MQLEEGQKLLVLRYSDFLQKNCIQLHVDLIDKLGFCWFGKIGQRPSQKFITQIMAFDKPQILLHSSTKSFLCEVLEVTYDKPESGYPQYYEEALFRRNHNPSAYFKLKSIEQVPKNILKSFIVVSSKNYLSLSLHRSMNSVFFVEYSNLNEENSNEDTL